MSRQIEENVTHPAEAAATDRCILVTFAGAVLPGVRAQHPGSGVRLRLPEADRYASSPSLDDLLHPVLRLLLVLVHQVCKDEVPEGRVNGGTSTRLTNFPEFPYDDQ